jgi:hypothetical protein
MADLNVINVQGKTLYSIPLQNQENIKQLNTTALPKGGYVLQLKGAAGVQHVKFVK